MTSVMERRGLMLVISSPSGAGKTTIADLIMRMFDPTSGQILIDDRKIESYDLSQLRQQIGYVPQDVFLFSDTIANNIRFGRPDASMEEVKTFARYASVYDDIMRLPQGFETLVGERGVTLSGGQKQRISIARAFIRKPDIVLLDDCLSAVDTQTEQTILGYLSDALANRTAIIITHRIYNSLNFDKILVLDEGRIIEEGTHEMLLDKGGVYYDLFNQQSLQDEQIEL